MQEIRSNTARSSALMRMGKWKLMIVRTFFLVLIITGVMTIPANVAAQTTAEGAVSNTEQLETAQDEARGRAAGASYARADRKYRIEGSWELDIRPAPGPGPSAPFKGLVTFDAGGGVVETLLLPPVTPAHGAWERKGRRKFSFAVVHRILDQNGNHVGTVRARSTAEFTGEDEFDAVYEGGFFDPNGTFLFPVSGTETARRIKVE